MRQELVVAIVVGFLLAIDAATPQSRRHRRPEPGNAAASENRTSKKNSTPHRIGYAPGRDETQKAFSDYRAPAPPPHDLQDGR
jgi:hypothetical protein